MAKTFQIISLFIVFLAIVVTSSVSAAVDMEKLINDKEAGSKQYRASELVKLYKKYPSGQVVKIVNKFTKDLAKVLNYTQKENVVCELYAARALMRLNKIPYAEPGLLREKLILARNFNKIDDVLFLILNRAAQVNEELSDLPKFAPRRLGWAMNPNRDILSDYKIKEGDRKALENAVLTLRRLSNERHGCVDVNLSYFDGQLAKFLKKKSITYFDRIRFFKTAVTYKWITDRQYNYAFRLIKDDVHEWKSNLSQYLEINQNSKNVFTDYIRTRKVTGAPLRAVAIKRYNLLSQRVDLYSKFDRHQVVMLADVMKKASIRMGADEFMMDSVASIRK